MLANPKWRALHNFIAGTVVVRTNVELPQTTGALPAIDEQPQPDSAFELATWLVVLAISACFSLCSVIENTRVSRLILGLAPQTFLKPLP
jgi:hypothetical protein